MDMVDQHELKRKLNEWCLPDSPNMKKLHQEPRNVNVIVTVVYDIHGVLFRQAVPLDQTLNTVLL